MVHWALVALPAIIGVARSTLPLTVGPLASAVQAATREAPTRRTAFPYAALETSNRNKWISENRIVPGYSGNRNPVLFCSHIFHDS